MRNIKFTYSDSKGKISHREVVVLSEAADFMSAIDLSEYTPEEREYFAENIQLIQQEFLDSLKELGVYSNFRRFKEIGISGLSEV